MMEEHKEQEDVQEGSEASAGLAASWKERLSHFATWKIPAGNSVAVKRTRIILLFVVGVAVGVIAKTEASPRLTMGFQDYTVAADPSRYDLNGAEKRVVEAQQQKAAEGAQGGSAAPAGLSGAACGQ